MNKAQASRLRRLLAARYPAASLDVTADSDGARISVEHPDGYTLRVTPGERPGAALRAMLGRDLRVVDGGSEGTA